MASASSQLGSQPPETVGFILNKVQEDLARLKDEVSRSVGSGGTVDALAIKAALESTQKELQMHAETTLQLMQDKATTLPHIVHPMSKARGPVASSRRSLGDMVHQCKSASHRLPRSKSYSGDKPFPRPSPGDVVKAAYTRKLLSHPHNPASKELISSRYGIPLAAPRSLPAPLYRELEVEVVGNKPMTGPTVNQLAAVPHSKRQGGTLSPPPICEEDAKKGLLSLMERGLIPCNADILLSPPPVKPRPAILHSASQQFLKVEVADNSELRHFPLAHLDMRDPDDLSASYMSSHMRNAEGARRRQSAREGQRAVPPPPPPVVCSPTHKGEYSPRDATLPSTLSKTHTPLAPPPTRSPGGLIVGEGSIPFFSGDGSECHLTMHRGALAEDDPDYVEFQRENQAEWGSVVSMLEEFRRLAFSFAVPLMVVDGAKLLALAGSYGVETKPTPQELISCLVNADEVQSIVSTPGRRYKGVGGVEMAAAKIQATFRMHQARKQYLELRKRRWAGSVIAMGWLLHLKARRTRTRVRERRTEERASFFRRAQEFKKTWSRVKAEKHVVVHLPSLGYPKDIRSHLDRLKTQENAQIARICDISNPNTEVIYVSPVVLSEDLESYNLKLLSLGQEGTQTEDICKRLTLITPESLGKFGGQNLSLSTVLLYSPKAMRRIRNLTRGKNAYILPGVVSEDDLAVAEQLGLPILGTDPNTVQMYSSRKAGAIKLFTAAKVTTPPSSLDVFGEHQLVSQLASLIANHLHIRRWCFKLNNSLHARGIAYCDVSPHLPCYSWLKKEKEWYGEKWNSAWAQEMAVKKIAEELADLLGQHTVMVDPAHFPTWGDFLAEIRRKGCLIQACPPSESVTALTVSMLIEPDGAVRMLSAGDQVNPTPFWKWGVSVPQTSVNPSALSATVDSVAAACLERGVRGHLSLDLVTFITPTTMEQELWAVDLDIGMSDMQAMSGLLGQVTGGSYCWDKGLFGIPGQGERMGEEARYGVMSTQLLHESLSLIHSSVFFHLCRAHLIGYNVKDKEGCVFTLQDDNDRSNFGMMCVHPSLFGALTNMANALSVIHQEVAMPTGACTNFKEVTEELRRVAAEVNDTDTGCS